MSVIFILVLYLVIVNLIGFIQMGIDKKRARRGAYRIPEANLFLTAAIGGSIGSILGMYTFRHKTKHLSFVIGMPTILLIQIGIIGYIVFGSPIEFTLM